MSNKKNEIHKILNIMVQPDNIMKEEEKEMLSEIKELNLKNYDIKVIYKQMNNNIICCFNYFPNLKKLDLSFNWIKEIHPNTFYKLPNLNELNISNNLIEKDLNFSFIKRLKNLISLNISNNLIYKFKHPNFKNLIKPIIFYKLKNWNFQMKDQHKNYKIIPQDLTIIKFHYPNLKFLNKKSVIPTFKPSTPVLRKKSCYQISQSKRYPRKKSESNISSNIKSIFITEKNPSNKINSNSDIDKSIVIPQLNFVQKSKILKENQFKNYWKNQLKNPLDINSKPEKNQIKLSNEKIFSFKKQNDNLNDTNIIDFI